jgi:hypothetical protein
MEVMRSVRVIAILPFVGPVAHLPYQLERRGSAYAASASS